MISDPDFQTGPKQTTLFWRNTKGVFLLKHRFSATWRAITVISPENHLIPSLKPQQRIRLILSVQPVGQHSASLHRLADAAIRVELTALRQL